MQTDSIINKYLKINRLNKTFKRKSNFEEIFVSDLKILSANKDSIDSGDDIEIQLFYNSIKIEENSNYEFVIGLWNKIPPINLC